MWQPLNAVLFCTWFGFYCSHVAQAGMDWKTAYLQFIFGKRTYYRISLIVGPKRIYRPSGPRGILFVSIASAADSFRSTWGLERGAPECSTQRFPAGTPHVGQGTEDNCLGVRSLIFIWIRCDKTSRKTVPFRTLCEPASETVDSTGQLLVNRACCRILMAQ